SLSIVQLVMQSRLSPQCLVPFFDYFAQLLLYRFHPVTNRHRLAFALPLLRAAEWSTGAGARASPSVSSSRLRVLLSHANLIPSLSKGFKFKAGQSQEKNPDSMTAMTAHDGTFL